MPPTRATGRPGSRPATRRWNLAVRAGAAVVLGSATPARSRAWAGRGRASYRRIALPDRAAAPSRRSTVVDLRAELAAGNRGPALAARWPKRWPRWTPRRRAGDPGHQPARHARRSSCAATAVTSRPCPECERPLVYHQAGMTLRCHHCGRACAARLAVSAVRIAADPVPGRRHGARGARGPGALPASARRPAGPRRRRAQGRRGARARRVRRRAARRAGRGPSLVAKGIDVPEVTLVGVVSADVALNLPDERAAERTYQLLAQAVGRAGRGERPGVAYIQTYRPTTRRSPRWRTGDAAAFYDEELALRRALRVAAVRPAGQAHRGHGRACSGGAGGNGPGGPAPGKCTARRPNVQVVGPAPAFIARRADKWRYHVILRGPDPLRLLDPPPGAPWSIDVDPETLL